MLDASLLVPKLFPNRVVAGCTPIAICCLQTLFTTFRARGGRFSEPPPLVERMVLPSAKPELMRLIRSSEPLPPWLSLRGNRRIALVTKRRLATSPHTLDACALGVDDR